MYKYFLQILIICILTDNQIVFANLMDGAAFYFDKGKTLQEVDIIKKSRARNEIKRYMGLIGSDEYKEAMSEGISTERLVELLGEIKVRVKKLNDKSSDSIDEDENISEDNKKDEIKAVNDDNNFFGKKGNVSVMLEQAPLLGEGEGQNKQDGDVNNAFKEMQEADNDLTVKLLEFVDNINQLKSNEMPIFAEQFTATNMLLMQRIYEQNSVYDKEPGWGKNDLKLASSCFSKVCILNQVVQVKGLNLYLEYLKNNLNQESCQSNIELYYRDKYKDNEIELNQVLECIRAYFKTSWHKEVQGNELYVNYLKNHPVQEKSINKEDVRIYYQDKYKDNKVELDQALNCLDVYFQSANYKIMQGGELYREYLSKENIEAYCRDKYKDNKIALTQALDRIGVYCNSMYYKESQDSRFYNKYVNSNNFNQLAYVEKILKQKEADTKDIVCISNFISPLLVCGSLTYGLNKNLLECNPFSQFQRDGFECCFPQLHQKLHDAQLHYQYPCQVKLFCCGHLSCDVAAKRCPVCKKVRYQIIGCNKMIGAETNDYPFDVSKEYKSKSWLRLKELKILYDAGMLQNHQYKELDKLLFKYADCCDKEEVILQMNEFVNQQEIAQFIRILNQGRDL